MSDETPSPMLRMPKEPVLLGILLLLCLFVFFFQLGERPLWNIDEGMHAEASKDILLTGDWIVPVNNGEPFYDKPIFYNWIGAVCFALFGLNEFAARLPSALLGTLCVFAAYLLGRRMLGVPRAFLGAAVLATSGMQIILSRAVVHDIALSMAVTASLAFFYGAYRFERHRTRNLLWFYFFLGVGFLAKGPLGVVLPGIPIGLVMLFDRRLGFISKMKPLIGLLIVILVAAPWYVAISVVTGDYAEYFFIGKNFGAFTEGKPFKVGGPAFYLPVVIGGLLPWTPVLPIALWRAFRGWRGPDRDAIRFLLAWGLGGLLFFSISTAKLHTYVLPMLPAYALLIGDAWYGLLSTRSESMGRAFRNWMLPFVIALAGAAVYLWIAPPQKLNYKYGVDLTVLAGFVSLLSVVVFATWLCCQRRRYGLHFAGYALISCTMLAGLTTTLAPMINPYRSSKVMAAVLDELLPEGERIPKFRRWKDSTEFYTDRKGYVMTTYEQMHEVLNSSDRVYILIDRRELEELRAVCPPFHIVARHGNDIVISNREGAIPGASQD